MKICIAGTFLLLLFGILFSPAFSQSVGINTITPNANSVLEISAGNKGVLIPRIDYVNRPTVNVPSGMLVFITANGPDGNNGYYYYTGTSWVRFYHFKEQQMLSLSNNILTITPGNSVDLGNVFPIQGYVKCGLNYINPQTDNNNCGSCGNICPIGKVCTNGVCL